MYKVLWINNIKKHTGLRVYSLVILCAVYSSIQFQHVKKEQTYPVCLLKIVAGFIIPVKPFSSFFS